MSARITIVCDRCPAEGASSMFDGSAPREEINRLREAGPVRRVPVFRAASVDLCPDCLAKHRESQATARAARRAAGGVH